MHELIKIVYEKNKTKFYYDQDLVFDAENGFQADSIEKVMKLIDTRHVRSGKELLTEMNKYNLKGARDTFEMRYLRLSHPVEECEMIAINNNLYIDFPFVKYMELSDNSGVCKLFGIMLTIRVSDSVLFIKNRVYFSHAFMLYLSNKFDKFIEGYDHLSRIRKQKQYIVKKHVPKQEHSGIVFCRTKSKPVRQKTYLMRDAKGYVKIGKSKKPKSREKTLQSEMPIIDLFATCEHDIELELHEKYSEKRLRGEWFKLDDKDIKEIIEQYNFIERKVL